MASNVAKNPSLSSDGDGCSYATSTTPYWRVGLAVSTKAHGQLHIVTDGSLAIHVVDEKKN
ncbi:hypothetical protein [Salinibacterium sp. SWN248]|uniref:hypothetical protein n=1 Tax=Salinibacterium sp. SWN248 TaxID=2792056 RepID=UPI0018CD4D2D|nr:hypothetical protein [Salinibacterium sp. SWN248]MBH0023974.1 hypothetical protein [Salinibacterium sp. SWN248]